MTDWLPIADAPKDGTRILVWANDPLWHEGLPLVAYWEWDSWDLSGLEFYECYDRGGFERTFNPTHWAPITPPKKGE